MKKLILLSVLLATPFLGRTDDGVDVSTTPTATMNVVKFKYVPMSFTQAGRHSFAVYKYAPDGSIIDRQDVEISSALALDWLSASNKAVTLKGIILNKLNLSVNTNYVAGTNWVNQTNTITVTNFVTVTNKP